MQEVVVLGRNFSTPLGVIRSLAKAGYTVSLLYVGKDEEEANLVASSKYLNRAVKVLGFHDQETIDALLSNFANEGSKPVLFPTDDYTALLTDRYREQLKAHFLFPHIVDGSIEEIMDKAVQSSIARRSGLNTPREWTVSLDTDAIQIPKDVVFPCFIKPMVGAKGGKSELQKCEDLQKLTNLLIKMQKRLRQRSAMIQEFLNIQQEYTIGGVSDGNDVYIPAIIKKLRVAQHFRGVTLSGVIVDSDEIGDYMSAILAFLKNAKYVGMFDMEVLMTDKGLYFGELNLRSGGPSYSYFVSGVNLPELAVEILQGKGIDSGKYTLTLNKRFLNNKVAWEDYGDLFVSGSEIRKMAKESDFTLMSDQTDPEPEKLFNRLIKPRYVKLRRKKRLVRFVRLMLKGRK